MPVVYRRHNVFRLTFGPSLSRTVPQFFTNQALQAQYATYAHAFWLGFFVTVENQRPVNPTPKRKVARWNRAGGTIFLHGYRKRVSACGRMPQTRCIQKNLYCIQKNLDMSKRSQ